MRAVHPHMTSAEAKRLLQQSANPSARCASLDDPTVDGCGAGLLDVDAAVHAGAQSAGDDPAGSRLGNIVHGGYGCAIGVSAGASSGAGSSSAGGAALALVAVALAALARRRRVL